MSAKRSKNFTEDEKFRLLTILKQMPMEVIESKSGSQGMSKKKAEVWSSVEKAFNAGRDDSKRDEKQLAGCWKEIKARIKKVHVKQQKGLLLTGGEISRASNNLSQIVKSLMPSSWLNHISNIQNNDEDEVDENNQVIPFQPQVSVTILFLKEYS